jgi:hypothetical protein
VLPHARRPQKIAQGSVIAGPVFQEQVDQFDGHVRINPVQCPSRIVQRARFPDGSMFNQQLNALPRLDDSGAWNRVVPAVQKGIEILPPEMLNAGVQGTGAAIRLVIRIRAQP